MFTLLTLCVIGFLWYSANSRYEKTTLWIWRRKRAAYSWAFVGAIAGSFFGVAGMGSAIAGTIPGAFVGYLIVSNVMKKDVDPTN